jgi:hypothetical protein
MRRLSPLAIAISLLATPMVARADDPAKSTVEGAVKTGADAIVDGARTFGRTTRAFFKNGASGAKTTWKENARTTAEDAKANGHATHSAAHGSH